MHPIQFKHQNGILRKPDSMTEEECGSLYIRATPDGQIISCWTCSFIERLKFLFHGKLWLGVVSGKSQPPVWLDMKKQIFHEKQVEVKEAVANG